jgi:hypothetical protein
VANFTTITLDLNTGTQASPVFTSLGGAATELRWSDVNTATNVASASWPNTLRPLAGTAQVMYAYAYTADAVDLGVLGNTTTTPASWVSTDYKWCKWHWDALGTFASAPIVTAYMSTAHGAITRANNAAADAILSGNTTDTGGTARSFMKANWYGNGATQVPAAAPTNAPVVTDGATGSLVPGSGAWLTNYQGLQGDNDYITCTATPAATTANDWYGVITLFMGVTETPAIFVPVVSLKYTWQ